MSIKAREKAHVGYVLFFCLWGDILAQEYAKKFYQSKAWRDLRNKVYRDNHGICERCGNIGLIVHHKIPITPENINDPDITLNEDNLELLCQECHNAIDHEELKNGKDILQSFDDEGNFIPPILEK